MKNAMKVMITYVFITDKIDTNQPWGAKPSDAPVSQTIKRHTAKT